MGWVPDAYDQFSFSAVSFWISILIALRTATQREAGPGSRDKTKTDKIFSSYELGMGYSGYVLEMIFRIWVIDSAAKNDRKLELMLLRTEQVSGTIEGQKEERKSVYQMQRSSPQVLVPRVKEVSHVP